MAPIVQTNTGGGTTTPLSPTWTTAPTSGNGLLCFVNSDTTVTTPPGWTILSTLVNSQGAYVFQRTATGSGDAPSLAFSPTGSPTAWTLIELNASEVGVADVQAVGTESAGSLTTKASTTITTTGTSGDYLLTVAFLHGAAAGTPNTPTWNNTFTQLVTSTAGTASTSTQVEQFIASRTQGAAGAVGATTCTWTTAAQNAMAFALSWKLVAAGATATDSPFVVGAAVVRASSW